MQAEQQRKGKTFSGNSVDFIDWDKLDRLQGSRKAQ